jgi:hypothetical protein
LDDWPDLFASYRRLGQPDELRILCQHFVRLAEQQGAAFNGAPAAQMWADVGAVDLWLNEPGPAVECARRAVHCDPDNKNTRWFCCQALWTAGLSGEAEPHIRWCLQRSPNDATLLWMSRQVTAMRSAADNTVVAGTAMPVRR